MKNWALLLLVAAGCSPTVVESGTVGVRTRWGKADPQPLHEGLYWRTWMRDAIIPMDTRVQKYESASSASSKDLQVVTTTIALNWRIDPAQAATVYAELGRIDNVQTNVVEPVMQEAVKTATARFTAEELITKRPDVKKGIEDYMKQALAASNVQVTDLNIVNFEFDAKYQQAVEAKQVAEQLALTATNDLRRIEVEAKQAEAQAQGRANAALIEAKAEAERQQLLKANLSADLVRWEAIRRWDGKLPQVAGESGMLVDLGLK
ncbi:MAG: prohibitin family protein [Myxococcota bacterium]